jgi:hypothetical protein
MKDACKLPFLYLFWTKLVQFLYTVRYVGIVKKIYLMLLAYGRSNPQEEFAQIGRQPHAIFKWV